MKLVIISDTHNRHRELDLPEGDVLIHCGDATMLGQSAEVIDFLSWFSQQPHTHKIFVPGNHDRLFESNPSLAWSYVQAAYGVECLIDSGIQVWQEGQSIWVWGTPWTPRFGNWSFMLPRGPEILAKFKKIPEGTDVLISHGPPMGVLDLSPYGNQHAGCIDLLDQVMHRIKPKVHCFGHIHDGYGATSDGDISYINAAICSEEYEPINAPVVVEV